MDKNSFDLITFGEIMLRLSPPRHARIVDGDIFEKRAGGAELNVASGVALLGLRTGIVSKLPQNELGTFIKNRIRFVGVSDDYPVIYRVAHMTHQIPVTSGASIRCTTSLIRSRTQSSTSHTPSVLWNLRITDLSTTGS